MKKEIARFYVKRYLKCKSKVCITRGGPGCELIPLQCTHEIRESFTKLKGTCYNASGVDVDDYDDMHHLFSDL